MAVFSQEHNLLNLSTGGRLHQTGGAHTPADQLYRIFQGFRASGRQNMTLFMHGGLVSEQEALDFARDFHRVIDEEFQSYPVFVIWEAGPLETIQSALEDIFGSSPLFLELLKKLTKHVAAKLNPAAELLAGDIVADVAAGVMPMDRGDQNTQAALLAALAQEWLPLRQPAVLDALRPVPGVQIELPTAHEIAALERDLAQDPVAQAALSVVLAELPRADLGTAMAALTPVSSYRTAYLDEVILTELAARATNPGDAAIHSGAAEFSLSPLTFWFFVGPIFTAVMARFANHTDHGLSGTILEEIYRHLYADKVGRFLWDEMKANAQDAYGDNPTGAPTDDFCGGTVFLTLLQQDWATHGRFTLNLVGHSAGCIHICHFVDRAAKMLGATFDLGSVIFAAPACNFATFHRYLLPHAAHIHTFRIFAMQDELERNDPLLKELPAVYPHSLLYLVSGLLEESPDVPLLGLARHLQAAVTPDDPIARAILKFLADLPSSQVFAKTGDEAAVHARATFTSHYGGTGPMADSKTLASIASLLRAAQVESTPTVAHDQITRARGTANPSVRQGAGANLYSSANNSVIPSGERRKVVNAHLDRVEAHPSALQLDQAQQLKEGRYTGGNGEISIELRIDGGKSGVISADIFTAGSDNGTWLASLRTPPAQRITLEQQDWAVVGEDQNQRLARGKLQLQRQTGDPTHIVACLRLESPLAGLRSHVDICFTATWVSAALRTLGIELEEEEGVAPLPIYAVGENQFSLESSLAAAGFETFEVGRRTRIPPPPNEGGWGTAELHALMVDHAQSSLTNAAWKVHLLYLGKPTRPGLFGIMFDTTAYLPRQGVAVFAEEIRQRTGENADRKLIQTTVHEIGHALNLAHRFERELGRANSTSFMNYDWRYRTGGFANEFWSRFDFTFDADELEFLCHGPHSAVIPGGRPFRSVTYWTEGNGGYAPYLPENPIAGFELKLSGPTGGVVFDFLQPVFLNVELFNHTGRGIEIPDAWLDPKGGALDVVIRRLNGSSRPEAPQLWVPVMQRCYDAAFAPVDFVQAGGKMQRNLNLTFGAGGFAFAEPGTYEVRAVVSILDQVAQKDHIIASNPLQIRIGFPKTREEEEDALVMLRNDVGLYFALGGSRTLQKAHDDLEEIRERRQGKSKQIADPIVANIVRCAGIDAGRSYLRQRDGKFVVDGDRPEVAAEWLGSLTARALQAFDADTAASTRQLAETHRHRAGHVAVPKK